MTMEVIGIRPARGRTPLVRIGEGRAAFDTLSSPNATPSMRRAAKFINDATNQLIQEPHMKESSFTFTDQPNVPLHEQVRIAGLVEDIALDVATSCTFTRYRLRVKLGAETPVYTLAPIPAFS